MEKLLDKLGNALFDSYGILGLVLALLIVWIYMLVTRILKNRDEQIKLLADENREYRERFTKLIDKTFDTEEDKNN